MSDRFTYTEYPNGKIKTLIADGTHWVTVADANMQESIGRAEERERVLADLQEQVRELQKDAAMLWRTAVPGDVEAVSEAAAQAAAYGEVLRLIGDLNV